MSEIVKLSLPEEPSESVEHTIKQALSMVDEIAEVVIAGLRKDGGFFLIGSRSKNTDLNWIGDKIKMHALGSRE